MPSPTLTRRALIAGAGTTVASSALAVPYVNAASAPDTLTVEQRRDFHLAEYKRACEELDPMIGHWNQWTDEHDGNLHVCGFRLTGRYEGDGVYESGRANHLGARARYTVTQRPGFIDGERAFTVSCPGDRLVLIESRLETFIGRRIA